MSKSLQAFMVVALTAVIIALIVSTTFNLMSDKNLEHQGNIENNHQL